MGRGLDFCWISNSGGRSSAAELPWNILDPRTELTWCILGTSERQEGTGTTEKDVVHVDNSRSYCVCWGLAAWHRIQAYCNGATNATSGLSTRECCSQIGSFLTHRHLTAFLQGNYIDNPQSLFTPDLYVNHPPQHTDSFLLFLKAVMLFGQVTDYNTDFQLKHQGSMSTPFRCATQ